MQFVDAAHARKMMSAVFFITTGSRWLAPRVISSKEFSADEKLLSSRLAAVISSRSEDCAKAGKGKC
jgi:hypothetical protein